MAAWCAIAIHHWCTQRLPELHSPDPRPVVAAWQSVDTSRGKAAEWLVWHILQSCEGLISNRQPRKSQQPQGYAHSSPACHTRSRLSKETVAIRAVTPSAAAQTARSLTGCSWHRHKAGAGTDSSTRISVPVAATNARTPQAAGVFTRSKPWRGSGCQRTRGVPRSLWAKPRMAWCCARIAGQGGK